MIQFIYKRLKVSLTVYYSIPRKRKLFKTGFEGCNVFRTSTTNPRTLPKNFLQETKKKLQAQVSF